MSRINCRALTRSLTRFFGLFVLLIVTANFSFAQFKPHEVIVKYKSNVRRTRSTMNLLYASVGVESVRRFTGTMRLFEQLILDDGVDVRDAIVKLEKNSAVQYAQPNYLMHALSDTPTIPCLFPGWPPGCKDDGDGGGDTNPKPVERPAIGAKPADMDPPVDDPNMSESYGLTKIDAQGAWKTAKGSQKMVVAVIDTGVDYNHEDLAFNMWRNPNAEKNDIVGWDFVHDDALPFDDHSHGTHCAGVIGAVGGNGKGISGVNQRVSIMALKFLSAEGSGDTAGAIRAIEYAVRNGAKVLSNSWGGKGDDNNKGLRDAIAAAEEKGVLFVVAAGNDGTDNDKDPVFPASFDAPNLISVGATDSKDGMAYFSNYGKKTVHLAAPGVDIYSSVPGNRYTTMSGTSMACPFVAGAAALVWSAHPKWSQADVKRALLESVDPLPSLSGKSMTGGRLNVAKAVASESKMP